MTLIRKYLVWLILATLAGIAGALLVHASLPVRYVSSVQTDVEPNLAALTIDWAPNMVTEQQVATSGVVLASAARALGTTPPALAEDLSATVSGTSATDGTANVLSISCAMPTAIDAQRCAAAGAAAYMAFRNETTQSKAVRKRDPIEVTLITAATLPTAPGGPGARILLPVGALLGLLLGIVAVLAQDHFDHRVRDRADLEECLGAPVAAAIPLARHAPDVFRRRPISPAAEAYRFLREHLNPLITSVPGAGAVLLVASPHAREGRSCVAVNLAAALAEPGASVILVDADQRRPSLSKVFGVGRRPGWSDLLAGRASLDEVAVPVPDVPGLRLVTAGPPGAMPAAIIQDARLLRALRDMRDQADVVVVDGAPLLEVSVAIALARVSDVVAVVADVRCTTREAVSAAAEQIRATGPRIIVGVLNGVRSPANAQPPPSPAHEPESLAPAAEVPAMLAGIVPPRGHNGQQRAQLGSRPTALRAPHDTETGADDGPREGEDPQQ